jgi:N4-(beta-N-acetylglucosaminyl)-L-asparaginase
MKNRREFIKISALGGAAILTSTACTSAEDHIDEQETNQVVEPIKPIVVSTWNHGEAANKAAWKILSSGGTAIDAVEAGVKVTESDPENMSVGLGGLPDRDGNVTLDACIMDHKSNCGAVAFLQEIENPISVARKVMEETPHIMLAGQGALNFALDQGFERKNLLTEKAEEAWKEWLTDANYQPVINSENHDTIGMLAIDEDGNIAGACTTSGMAYKLHGRVGDSPIIGAGLFIDGEVGGACATGVGEAVIKTAGSAMVVELMRNGNSPEEACRIVAERVVSKYEKLDNLQVGFIALNKDGVFGSYSIYEGFEVAKTDKASAELIKSPFKLKWG